MYEATLQLLTGGVHRCDPTWTKRADRIDQCYKIYIPLQGEATLDFGGQREELKAGQIYFISGYRLAGQACQEQMQVDWLHFVPASLTLSFSLGQVVPFLAWPLTAITPWKSSWRQFEALFSQPSEALYYRIESLLLFLIADLLENHQQNTDPPIDPRLERLGPALDFMDRHYLQSPNLEAIAAAAHLAPTYFHRCFTQTFSQTPLAYMLHRRMNVARQLLVGTQLAINEVARRSGYEDPYYFSRLFRRHFGITPSNMRHSVRI